MFKPVAISVVSEEQHPLLAACDSKPPLEHRLSSSRRLPHAIAHRGFKAQFPENTLGAFEGAVRAGAHAIETDLHLSSDGVVVICHDATLKRCFGVEGKVIDFDYSYLSTLRTLQAPHVPMPSLKEVLELFCEPALKNIWLLLDIKMDNDAEDIMRLAAETVRAVNSDLGFWRKRIALGCWTLEFLPLCDKYFPVFQITHIGFSLSYAKEFLKHPNTSFNLFYAILSGSKGKLFLEEARAGGRDVYVWTVNDDQSMRWATVAGFDGVCTDNPVKFLQQCHEYTSTTTYTWTLRELVHLTLMRLIAWLLSVQFRWKYV